MSDPLRPVSRPRLYEQVVAQLRAYADAAGLRKGDRLPSERDLAERLQISRASLKQAIVVLEVQGLVEIRHGGGTYLRTDSLHPEPVERLVERRRRLPDVLDAREAVETKLAELAARRRTEADLEEIDAALAAMHAEIERGAPGEDGDRRFHAAVTAAAHSELLADFMTRIAGQIAETRHESLQQPDRPQQSLAQHAEIADAIRAGNPEAAVEAMRTHLDSVRRVRLLDWDPES
ncbi:GntR family transcriptional repressor for pyruvate dehydrogenase complex [Amycolatopsis bartoniae]|uniref:GntR family transcriptional regulator n=1 Tax=Amycolatopsis bartoniae TaxID=941986 RepID=A0A8H9IMT1_9PSEU|nr:FadR/GntR family transcriptional regulator [Amycolatopsis bartoniae]MBB2938155.1 GntR family transcriptional repressor for pyruvate dehydrogenase complex [Amycolatopsis bartoniae]TVT03240.1 FadR family transcriptional regulator [Amycolatopsis bartoniae]GHF33058.1 GntR family transcriptional regulator [Amycolatopsis bartoniae]